MEQSPGSRAFDSLRLIHIISCGPSITVWDDQGHPEIAVLALMRRRVKPPFASLRDFSFLARSTLSPTYPHSLPVAERDEFQCHGAQCPIPFTSPVS